MEFHISFATYIYLYIQTVYIYTNLNDGKRLLRFSSQQTELTVRDYDVIEVSVTL